MTKGNIMRKECVLNIADVDYVEYECNYCHSQMRLAKRTLTENSKCVACGKDIPFMDINKFYQSMEEMKQMKINISLVKIEE